MKVRKVSTERFFLSSFLVSSLYKLPIVIQEAFSEWNLIILNEKLISMCVNQKYDVRDKAKYQIWCYLLFKSHSWHRTEIYDNV